LQEGPERDPDIVVVGCGAPLMLARSKFLVGAVAALVAVALGSPLLAQGGLLEKRESLYNNIFIFGDGDTVTMTFGHNKRYYTESSMKLSDPGALTVDYTRLMTIGVAYVPKAERILEIGLGGGRTVSYLSAAMPDTAILAVEIDKDVVELAKKHFKFTETARLRTVVSDGRSFLMRDRDTWDIILIDAYRGPFVPFHLLTKEFYNLVKSRLSPGGRGAEHRALHHAVRFRHRDAQERVPLGRSLRRRRQRGCRRLRRAAATPKRACRARRQGPGAIQVPLRSAHHCREPARAQPADREDHVRRFRAG
jgi:predicted O-methyltransferase YrrM